MSDSKFDWLILQAKFKLRRGGIVKGRLKNPNPIFQTTFVCLRFV
ncbi:hypothetical protein [Neisseria sicca]|nr:hypothetical protein [Neisseria sicca]